MRVPLALLVIGWIAGCTGCMVAIPQPGQSPVQVQTCTTDATWHNFSLFAAGSLAAGAATQASIAATQDPGVGKTLAISGAVTGALAGVATLGAGLLAKSYSSDGCVPPLPTP